MKATVRRDSSGRSGRSSSNQRFVCAGTRGRELRHAEVSRDNAGCPTAANGEAQTRQRSGSDGQIRQPFLFESCGEGGGRFVRGALNQPLRQISQVVTRCSCDNSLTKTCEDVAGTGQSA